METPTPLPNEYNALLRHLVTALGVALSSRGLVTAEDWQLYGGFIISIAPPIFAFIVARRNKRKMQELATVAAATTKVAINNEFAKEEVHTREDAKDNVVKQVAAEVAVAAQNGAITQ